MDLPQEKREPLVYRRDVVNHDRQDEGGVEWRIFRSRFSVSPLEPEKLGTFRTERLSGKDGDEEKASVDSTNDLRLEFHTSLKVSLIKPDVDARSIQGFVNAPRGRRIATMIAKKYATVLGSVFSRRYLPRLGRFFLRMPCGPPSMQFVHEFVGVRYMKNLDVTEWMLQEIEKVPIAHDGSIGHEERLLTVP